MKNILARGGIEFLAVLLGISGSLWVDDYRIELANQEKTIITLGSLKKELEICDLIFKTVYRGYVNLNGLVSPQGNGYRAI